jgi:hypothetical protein
LGNSATATSCGIQNQCVWQKVSGSESRNTIPAYDKINDDEVFADAPD